jgi:hypothetical protein
MHAFGGGFAADAAAMRETDVLVGVHGAGLTNLGFLRPGSTVVEVRPGAFLASNADRFYRPLAQDSGVLKYWCMRLHGGMEAKGEMEAAQKGNPEKYERDRDVFVPWAPLREVLERVLSMSFDEWRAAAASGSGPGQGPFTDVSA